VFGLQFDISNILMWLKNIQSVLLIALCAILISITSGYGQIGRRAKRASLKTRNKQISRFTVRTDFSKSKKYISFGGGMGISNYFGDLAPRSRRGSSDLSYTRTYMSAFYLHRIHPHITIRGALTWMRLRGDDYSVSSVSTPTGDDKGRFARNLSFRNDIFEISGVGIFELFPTDRGFLRRNFINPYGILGLSIFRHNPQTKTPIESGVGAAPSKWVDLKPLGTEGQYTGIPGTPRPYSLIQIGIPLGVGVRYRLLDKWDLSFEFCYRFVFTDYIDDVSGKYPSDSVYQQMLRDGNELGVILSNRSAEDYAAIEGAKRQDVFKRWKDKGLSRKEAFLQKETNETGAGPFKRLDGNENGAAPRGNKRRDYWLCTAVHLAYILEIKQKPPKFR
jgi:hypothetical protein